MKFENAALHVVLHINGKKTKCMVYNQQEEVNLRTQDGSFLEVVKDFKYLGSWVQSTEQDIKTRKALAWKACNKLDNIWKSNLSKNIKVKLFQATVESILLYGCETWTVTKKIGKSLDGCYTRMLRSALDVSWRDHMTNKELYGDLPKITTKITKRRLQFAGHCARGTGKMVTKLITWRPTQGKRSAGRPTKTYVDLLHDDTGLTPSEIETCMQDRRIWRVIIDVRQKSTYI